MQQRYMDPQLGMFLSTGPVAAYQRPTEQFIQYRYAKGNPYKFTDPDGRQATTNSLPSIFPIPIPNRFPDGPLPTKPSGEPAPDPDAAGPHTHLASATAETESTIRPENLMAAGGQLRPLILLITADRVIIRTRTNIPMNRAL